MSTIDHTNPFFTLPTKPYSVSVNASMKREGLDFRGYEIIYEFNGQVIGSLGVFLADIERELASIDMILRSLDTSHFSVLDDKTWRGFVKCFVRPRKQVEEMDLAFSEAVKEIFERHKPNRKRK